MRHDDLQLLVTRSVSRQIKLLSVAQADVDDTSGCTLGRRRLRQRHSECAPTGAGGCFQGFAKRPAGLPVGQVSAISQTAENERLLGS